MRKIIGFLFAAAALAAALVWPLSSHATSFKRGETLSHLLSLCVNKANALEILKADSEAGFEAADAIWQAKDDCVTIPVVGGPTVGKVVASAQVERGGKNVTMSVVEILDAEGNAVAHFFTVGDVDQREGSKSHPTIKGDRNT